MATRPLVDKTTAPPPLPVADRLQLAEELLDLAERVQAHTRAAGSAIALKLGDKLYVRTSTGIAPEVGASLLIGEGAIGQCARSTKPCNLPEDQIDASLRALGVRSLIAVPIHHAGIFYGVLVALAQTPEAFTRMQVAIMMTMGNEVARVLKRMEAAAMEIAPGAPLRTSDAAPAVPDDTVVELSLTPTARQDIVATLKTIEQKPEPAPMKLMIDPPAAMRLTPVLDPKPTPAPVLTHAQQAAVSFNEVDAAHAAPKPLPGLLPPGEDPRRYGTLKTAKSLEPKPTFVTANAYAQPRRPSHMRAPAAMAAVVVIAAAGFALWRHNHVTEVPHRNPVAAVEPTPASATAPVSAPAPEAAKAAAVAPAPVFVAKVEPEKKQTAATQEDATVASPEPALHIAAAKRTEFAPAEAPNAPTLALAANTALPDLGAPKVMPAKLLVKPTSTTAPVLLRQVVPTYPEIARRAGTAGTVRLQATISPAGKVSNVRVLDGPSILRAAAINAVSQWQYRPATLDGRVVESTMTVTVKFGQP